MSADRYGTILTYGTFDMLHVGHVRLLQRLHEVADRVIVGVSSDAFNSSKGKRAMLSEEDRLEIVSSLRYVHHSFLESSWEQKEVDIARFGADAIAMGDDWIGRFDHLRSHCAVLYLPRTEGVSSSALRATMAPLLADRVGALKDALDAVSALLANFE